MFAYAENDLVGGEREGERDRNFNDVRAVSKRLTRRKPRSQ